VFRTECGVDSPDHSHLFFGGDAATVFAPGGLAEPETKVIE